MHRHVLDTIVILEVGNLPLLRFPQCDMFVYSEEFNMRYLYMEMCAKSVEQKRR